MNKKYYVRYRKLGCFLWNRLKNVIGDGIEPGMFRWFLLEDDSMIYVPLDTEVHFSKERAAAILQTLSKEAGQQVVRA